MIQQYRVVPIWLTWIVTMVYFVLTPLMGMAYFLYTVSVIYTESPQVKRIMAVGMIPGAFYAVIVLSNPFNRLLFDINRSDGYTRGPLIPVTYLIFYAYCLASIALTLVNYKRIDRKIYRILAAFPILAVAVIIIQEMYPEVILSGSAATCALLIIYLHLQNKQISVDYLTNVPNRQELLNMLKIMIKKDPGRRFTLLVVSLRDFRQVNNTCGQQKGDEFLKMVCRFLCEAGPAENVYRFNGDEFALLFPEAEMIKYADVWKRYKSGWNSPGRAGITGSGCPLLWELSAIMRKRRWRIRSAPSNMRFSRRSPANADPSATVTGL